MRHGRSKLSVDIKDLKALLEGCELSASMDVQNACARIELLIENAEKPPGERMRANAALRMVRDHG